MKTTSSAIRLSTVAMSLLLVALLNLLPIPLFLSDLASSLRCLGGFLAESSPRFLRQMRNRPLSFCGAGRFLNILHTRASKAFMRRPDQSKPIPFPYPAAAASIWEIQRESARSSETHDLPADDHHARCHQPFPPRYARGLSARRPQRQCRPLARAVQPAPVSESFYTAS